MDRYNEIDMEDSEYRQHFNNALKEFYHRTGGGGDDKEELNKDGNDEEELNGDPVYDCFLKNLKQDGNDFSVQIPICSGISLVLKYDGEDEESFGNVDRRRNFLSNLTSKKTTVLENLGGFSGKAMVDKPKTVKKSLKIGDQVIKEKTRDVPDRERKSGDNESVRKEGPEVDPVSCKSSREPLKTTSCVGTDERWAKFPDSLDKFGKNTERSYEKDHTSTHHKDDGGYTPVPSKRHRVAAEESRDTIFTSSQSQFREKLMALLRTRFDQKELNSLWRKVTERKSEQGDRDLHHRGMEDYSTKTRGKSHLERHQELRMKIDECRSDDRKVLSLLRGFFFWLENSGHEGAFEPWLDTLFLNALG